MKLEHTTTTTIDQDFFYALFKDASPMDIAMCVTDAILAKHTD